LGRFTAATGLRASAPSRTAVSSTPRRIVYAERTVDSDRPLPRSATTHASTCIGRIRSSGNAPSLLPTMCFRVMPAYIVFVVALRSDAARADPIHSTANVSSVALTSRAGRCALSRARTSLALSRASLAVFP
jgi:hypothetical protein